ncbi:MAG: hypothetical protein HUN04_19630 [Desulfobacter sp.]|nr:MAG: hypothetical protein HUN04_17095 [Desulfobacter sp.]WDP91799.1 MAG: hypothetical protein HUN04_19630 [Desulfobacter sp.]
MMADLFYSTIFFMFPIYLVVGILLVRLLFVKFINPAIGFSGKQISKKINWESATVKGEDYEVYQLPNSIKILAILIVCYTTYYVFNRESTYGGLFESYLFFGLSWAFFLFQIYKIELIEDQYLVFHRVLKKTKFEIKEITHDFDGIRYYRLYYKNGSVYLDHMIQGIESFKNRINKLNPEMSHEELSAKNLHKDIWGFQFAFHYIIFGLGLIALIIFVCIKIFFNFWT